MSAADEPSALMNLIGRSNPVFCSYSPASVLHLILYINVAVGVWIVGVNVKVMLGVISGWDVGVEAGLQLIRTMEIKKRVHMIL